MKSLFLVILSFLSLNGISQKKVLTKENVVVCFSNLLDSQVENFVPLLTGNVRVFGAREKLLYFTVKPTFAPFEYLEYSPESGVNVELEGALFFSNDKKRFKGQRDIILDAAKEVFIPLGYSYERSKPIKRTVGTKKEVILAYRFEKPDHKLVIETKIQIRKYDPTLYYMEFQFQAPCKGDLARLKKLQETNNFSKMNFDDSNYKCRLFYNPAAPDGTIDYITSSYNGDYTQLRVPIKDLSILIKTAEGYKREGTELDNAEAFLRHDSIEVIKSTSRNVKHPEQIYLIYTIKSQIQQENINNFFRSISPNVEVQGGEFNEQKSLTFAENCQRFKRSLIGTGEIDLLASGFNTGNKSRVAVDIYSEMSSFYAITITKKKNCEVGLSVNEWTFTSGDQYTTSSFSGDMKKLISNDLPVVMRKYGIASQGVDFTGSEGVSYSNGKYHLTPVITTTCADEGELYYLFFSLK